MLTDGRTDGRMDGRWSNWFTISSPMSLIKCMCKKKIGAYRPVQNLLCRVMCSIFQSEA